MAEASPERQNDELIEALKTNWTAEMEGARTYSALAEQEQDPDRKEILQEMAEAESSHAAKWERRLRELGAEPPGIQPSLSRTVKDRLLKGGGVMAVIRRMEADEDRDIERYQHQLEGLRDAESLRIIQDALADEKQHRERLNAIVDTETDTPDMALDRILRREKWHRTGGGWIGDAIYGVNDGLGAIFGIVSGVSGATAGSSHYVILAGLAGMFASSLSMGSGAYLATKSEHEMREAQLAHERQEIIESPEEERRELELIYRLKGFSREEAHMLTERIAADQDLFVKTLAQEELGISEEHAQDPITSAVSGSISTAIGAIIPVIPFFFLSGYSAIIAAAIVSLIAHFAVGAAKTLVTIRKWWASGLEMTIIGAAEGVITYGLGLGFGKLY